MTFAATILTLYPEMFPGPLRLSLADRASDEQKWSCDCSPPDVFELIVDTRAKDEVKWDD